MTTYYIKRISSLFLRSLEETIDPDHIILELVLFFFHQFIVKQSLLEVG